jgi:hypothetical protein
LGGEDSGVWWAVDFTMMKKNMPWFLSPKMVVRKSLSGFWKYRVTIRFQKVPAGEAE